MLSGREFHADGPACEKASSPNLDRIAAVADCYVQLIGLPSRNGTSDDQARAYGGRLFHAPAEATRKARSPRVARRVDGTCSVVVSEERRQQRATIYVALCMHSVARQKRLLSCHSIHHVTAALTSPAMGHWGTCPPPLGLAHIHRFGMWQ